MEIKLNTNLDSVARLNNISTKASRPVDRPAATTEFGSSQALEAQLRALPDVRQEKLKQAQDYIGNPAYPPRETIQRLAALLAIEEDKGSFQSSEN